MRRVVGAAVDSTIGMAPRNPNDLVAAAPLPGPLLARLAPCHPFTRPTWANVLLLVTGTLLAPGGRTVTAALRILGRRAAPRFPYLPPGSGPGAVKLATIMDHAEPDVLAYMTFPKEHRAKLHSTNPIERLNGEIKRRTEVVGFFPNDEAIVRLVGASCSNETMNGQCSGPDT